MTKSNSLKGIEMTVGDSIIMPSDISAEATIRSMTRKGRKMRKPIWKARSEEHTSELQSLMRISYAVFCLKKKKKTVNEVHPSYTLIITHPNTVTRLKNRN